MALIDDVNKFKIIFDYLYWTNQLSEKNKDKYKSFRFRNFSSIPEEYNVYKNLAIDFLGNMNFDFNKLLSLALRSKESEEYNLKMFEDIINKQPQLKQVIQQGINNIKQTYPQESEFAKREVLYKDLYNSIASQLPKNVRTSPEEKELIKKNLNDILSVFNYVMKKLSMAQQKKLHDIESKYLDAQNYYSDEHIDDLLNFYDTLPLPPIDSMVSKASKKSLPEPLSAKPEHLNIVKKIPTKTMNDLIVDINNLQGLTKKKVSFGVEGQISSYEEIKKELPHISETTIKAAVAIINYLEKFVGQKIILE